MLQRGLHSCLIKVEQHPCHPVTNLVRIHQNIIREKTKYLFDSFLQIIELKLKKQNKTQGAFKSEVQKSSTAILFTFSPPSLSYSCSIGTVYRRPTWSRVVRQCHKLMHQLRRHKIYKNRWIHLDSRLNSSACSTLVNFKLTRRHNTGRNKQISKCASKELASWYVCSRSMSLDRKTEIEFF